MSANPGKDIPRAIIISGILITVFLSDGNRRMLMVSLWKTWGWWMGLLIPCAFLIVDSALAAL
jgi:hypothetical protein